MARNRSRVLAIAGLFLLAMPARSWGADDGSIPAEGRYTEVARVLEEFIAGEIDVKRIPGASIALVVGDRIVWARGFGWADAEAGRPATADTVYRVGSVSKLFADLAAMRLADAGRLDIDAPADRFVPGFQPRNPFGGAITLRQMMAHRSGLVREPPVGHYFDPTGPTLEACVASLNGTEVVYPPGARIKYSNAAIAAVGRAVEVAAGEPFVEYVRRQVIRPLGLQRTDFELTPQLGADLARARMWGIDGRSFAPPEFPIGTLPAGNLYSSVTDLARFLSALFAGGEGPGGAVVRPETLGRMMTLQDTEDPQARGFGIGFSIEPFGGRKRIGHGGMVYGFATELAALPDERLGVAVAASLDGANGLTRRIADEALARMLASRAGEAVRPIERTGPVDADLARRLTGRYLDGARELRVEAESGRLYLTPPAGHARLEVRLADGRPVVDDPREYGTRVEPIEGGLRLGGREYRRADDPRPPAAPDDWRGLIGEYGWDHDVLYILERGGRLHALIEWFFLDPLEPVAPDVFAFPDSGLYAGEKLIFKRGDGGKAARVEAGSVTFERRRIDGEDGATFRIRPLRPPAELREAAKRATPPAEPGPFREPELVELTALEPSIRLDIRYATGNNFAGTPFYSQPRAFLQRPAAEALVRAHRSLEAEGLGLLVHDAYRPWHVTKMFWEATPPESRGFVADPAEGSKHNRGAAVDLTLCDRATGRPLEMVGGYDEFSDRSRPDYPGGTSLQRWGRDRLRRAMEEQGFAVNELEWWHFDHRDWERYPILNRTFEELDEARGG